MTRFDLLDEYSSVIVPDYAPRRRAADAAAAQKASAWLKTLVAVLGGVLIVASLHGVIFGEPQSAMQVVAGR